MGIYKKNKFFHQKLFYKGQGDKELFRKINTCRPDYPPYFTNEVQQMITKVLRFHPKDRLPLEEVKIYKPANLEGLFFLYTKNITVIFVGKYFFVTKN